MKKIVIIFTSFFLIYLACFSSEVKCVVTNRIVAIVNDQVITLYELNNAIKQRTGMDPWQIRERSPDSFIETRAAILDQLINDKLTKKKIDELGIKVSSNEIDATIERLKINNHWTQEDLFERLKQEGLTYEKYRNQIKSDLEKLKLVNLEVKSKIIIRDMQIINYYNTHQIIKSYLIKFKKN